MRIPAGRIVFELGEPKKLTEHGQRLSARKLYAKGQSFVAAAILLRQRGGVEDVVLHCLCQGTEIMLKALLLLLDYKTYKPRMTKYGHDLEQVVAAAVKAFGVRPLRPAVAQELKVLSAFYRKHLLRYDALHDLLPAGSLPSDRALLLKVGAVMRLAHRKLSAGDDPPIEGSAPSSA
ncbi:hypothetical protein I6F35_06175 [Bradyrhizobium sp. BRP22]|uniref:hypothetical protein n=1 Tax=Bradyrhizobium sp. BRP22 TaxID=2793821 RepID=UPI001CD3912C|nr:hypothetical protein [Bradyrhizobium sp. BRP22]MCA1452806.1 hypothetical protein [Bradyrhizobium sp. BRP22]